MIKISKNNGKVKLDHKVFTFPAGELGVKLDSTNLLYPNYSYNLPYQTITARLQNSNDIMELLLVTDALRRLDPRPISLVLPWLPYARQDRVCSPGESHSIKVFAQLINNQGYESVTVFDPHSEVVGAVIDRVTIISQLDIIGKFDNLNKYIINNSPIFVSPDAGSNKKVAMLAAHYGHSFFVRADKSRDLATGKLSGFKVYTDNQCSIKDRDVIVCDDIADGAGTFIGLAKTLKENGARKVVLYVTHGIWSKGLDSVFDGGIDEIYCTDSFLGDIDLRVNVLRLDNVFS